MIRTALIGLGCVLGFEGAAAAQYQYPSGPSYQPSGAGYGTPGYGYGYGNSSNVMPNIYNPRTQPLSPYLNLMRGGNPGVNYYYGVRPGTVAGGMGGFTPGIAPGGNRPSSFPVQYGDPDMLELPTADKDHGYALPPAGHPVVFNNTLGYFPGGPGANAGMMRPGLGGTSSGSRTGTRR